MSALLFMTKKKRAERALHVIEPVEILPGHEEGGEPDKEIQIKRLFQAIASLSALDRVIIALLLDNNSYEDISNITGLSVSNVGIRITRAKKKLKRILS